MNTREKKLKMIAWVARVYSDMFSSKQAKCAVQYANLFSKSLFRRSTYCR